MAGLGAMGLSGCGAPTGARPLFASDSHPADYPTLKAVDWMGAELAKRTDGRLSIRTYAGGQLGEEKDTLELTIFGGIDINRVNLAALAPIAAETVAPTLPFLFRSITHMRAALIGPAGEAVLASLAPHGLIGLCFYESGARSFYTVNRPIQTPADMRGLKIRVQNSDMFVAMVDALGADATPMSYGEVYGALLQGVVDGAENNWPSYESSRHYEAAPHYALTYHVMAPEILVMSRRRWDRLSPDDQGTVKACARESVALMQSLWTERETAAEARLRKAGVKVTEAIDRAAFEARVLPVWDKFIKTPASKRLVEDLRNTPEAA